MSIDPTDVLAIERLLTDFAWFADRGDGAALGDLFLEEATLIVGGRDLRGPRQIAEDCRRRFTDPHRKTRHLWTNLRVERGDQECVATSALQLTFEQSTPGLPVQLRVNDLHDEFRKDGGGRWRFARRRIERAMALALPLSATAK
jgi:ketosteroid isomerase-like protein